MTARESSRGVRQGIWIRSVTRPEVVGGPRRPPGDFIHCPGHGPSPGKPSPAWCAQRMRQPGSYSYTIRSARARARENPRAAGLTAGIDRQVRVEGTAREDLAGRVRGLLHPVPWGRGSAPPLRQTKCSPPARVGLAVGDPERFAIRSLSRRLGRNRVGRKDRIGRGERTLHDRFATAASQGESNRLS